MTYCTYVVYGFYKYRLKKHLSKLLQLFKIMTTKCKCQKIKIYKFDCILKIKTFNINPKIRRNLGRTRRDLVLMSHSSFSHYFSLFPHISVLFTLLLQPAATNNNQLPFSWSQKRAHTCTHGEGLLVGNPVTSQVPAWTCRAGAWMSRGGGSGGLTWRSLSNLKPVIQTSALLFLG